MGVGWESLLRIGAEKAPISVGTGRASLDIVIEKNGAKTVHFEGYPEFISGIEVAVVAPRRLLVFSKTSNSELNPHKTQHPPAQFKRK